LSVSNAAREPIARSLDLLRVKPLAFDLAAARTDDERLDLMLAGRSCS
jgi:hypothetical protein